MRSAAIGARVECLGVRRQGHSGPGETSGEECDMHLFSRVGALNGGPVETLGVGGEHHRHGQ